MLLISLLLAVCFSQSIQVQLSEDNHVSNDQVIESVSRHFSDKFYCFKDEYGMYGTWASRLYPDDDGLWFCCGYMANGRKQCDKLNEWKMVNGNTFTLCETTYQSAIAKTRKYCPRNIGNCNKEQLVSVEKPRRDLCCSNQHFQDCTSCKSFVVWDFTVEADSYAELPDNVKNANPDPTFGGDRVLEASYNCNKDSTAPSGIPDASQCADIVDDSNRVLVDIDGRVTLKDTWRDVFYTQPDKVIEGTDITYPPYAYSNEVYPAGFSHATLREFNDPPVCVYAPNVGGRVLEIRVEPEEAGSQLCVDDLLADTAEKNNPGVTQACDDVRLQTCFPDANSDGADAGGFAFLISCSESCADGDVDLWFRLRASVNKWTEAGDILKGTDKTEVNTEMWCMWGNQNMIGELPENINSFAGLDGDFSRWDVYPSDLEPETDPQVRPVESNVSCFSFALLISALALLF